MGRQKKYIREGVIEKATEFFHENGFNPSNTKQIIDAVGINKFSLYSEFESNKDLFIQCLEHYFSYALEPTFGTLEKESSNIDDIILMFKNLPKRSRKSKRYGCLLCNTAMEFSDTDPEITPIIDKYFKRIKASFKNALTNSAEQKLGSSKVDIQESANFLSNSIIGVMASNRVKLPVKQVEDTCQSVVFYLENLKNKTRGIEPGF